MNKVMIKTLWTIGAKTTVGAEYAKNDLCAPAIWLRRFMSGPLVFFFIMRAGRPDDARPVIGGRDNSETQVELETLSLILHMWSCIGF